LYRSTIWNTFIESWMFIIWFCIWTIITVTVRCTFLVINCKVLKNLSAYICLSTKLYCHSKCTFIMYHLSFNNSLNILRQWLSDKSWCWTRKSHLERNILCVISWTLCEYSSSYKKFLMNLRTVEIKNNCITA
jgi:hypothetical protein